MGSISKAMSIQIEWDNEEETIIRYTFLPGWSVEEFHDLYNKPTEMLAEAQTELIGIIVDDSHDAMPPSTAVLAFKRMMQEGRSPLVVVNINPAAHILLEAARASSKSNRPVFYADSIPQARKILQAYTEGLYYSKQS